MIHLKLATYYTTYPGYFDKYGRRTYNKQVIIVFNFPTVFAFASISTVSAVIVVAGVEDICLITIATLARSFFLLF